jgi:competence protein ComGC
MCSYNSTQHDADSAAAAVKNSSSSSSKMGDFGSANMRHLAVESSVSAARAVLHPQRLPQLLGLLPELLAPQRVAVGLALLDSALRIGEHEVTLGPSCELQGVKTSGKSAGSSSSISSTASSSKGTADVREQVSSSCPGQRVRDAASNSSKQSLLLSQLPLLLMLPRAVPQPVLDAGAAAAADVVSAQASRQQLLHAVDTVLAMLTLRAAAKAKQEQAQQQQQGQIAPEDVADGNAFTRASAAVTAAFTAAQMAVSRPDTGVLGTPVVAAAAAGVAAAVAEARSVVAAAAATKPKAVSERLHQAAAVASCALGNPHSCLEVEEAAAAAQQQQQGCGGSNSSGSSNAELLATFVGLHVSLAGDLWGLWWAYHANVALRLRMQRA